MSKDLFFEKRQEEMAQFAEDVENGKRDALIAYAEIKRLEAETIAVRKQLEEAAISEAEKFPEKSFEHQGVKFELRNGSRRFSYKNISKWKQAMEEVKSIEKSAKMAFEAKQKGILTATEDGEEIELPEVKYSKSSLIIKRND